jgi:hypothetical protein
MIAIPIPVLVASWPREMPEIQRKIMIKTKVLHLNMMLPP